MSKTDAGREGVRMLVTIQLPASKDRVTVREIPALIATALHPDIAEGTPRQITQLMKMPTTTDNAANWCGAGCKPFPVSMSDDDTAELAAGIWTSLPPLKLPLSEPDWQPYWEAYTRNPPTGWELVPMSHDPAYVALVGRHGAANEWRNTIRSAAMNGILTPRHPATLLPQPQAAGEWLLDCFVTVADLAQFLTRFDIGVTQENGPTEKDCFIPLSSASAYLANKQWGDDASEESALERLNYLGANPGCFTPIMAVRSLVELEHQRNIDALENNNALKLYSPTSHVPTTEKAGALVRESEIVELLMAGAHLVSDPTSAIDANKESASNSLSSPLHDSRLPHGITTADLVATFGGYMGVTDPSKVISEYPNWATRNGALIRRGKRGRATSNNPDVSAWNPVQFALNLLEKKPKPVIPGKGKIKPHDLDVAFSLQAVSAWQSIWKVQKPPR